MCNMWSTTGRPIRRKIFWEEMHDSEIAKKHRGQLTKARQMIQEEQGEGVTCYV